MSTVTMYRPVGPAELELVKESGYTSWPARLPEQPFFYPVTNETYAREVTQWNIESFGVGYVTRFQVNASFAARFEIHQVGDAHHKEWWIPADQVDELNKHLVGLIEVVGEYREQALKEGA